MQVHPETSFGESISCLKIKTTMKIIVLTGFLVGVVCACVHAAAVVENDTKQNGEMWIQDIEHGMSSFHPNPTDYQVFRNVMDFGCAADGVTDDTLCINEAISSGGRCGIDCGSSTVTPALVYFPSGRYLVSSPIVMYYFTQLVGNANDRPVLVAAPGFSGMAVIDSNPYGEGGDNWYINQNNFFRQVRNFVIDLTQTPSDAVTTGVHWQVAQATSLLNLHFIMSTDPGTQHQGIWMENGSGGFMSDLVFDGGKFGMWVGNQQFLSRHLEFNGCDTAIYINWNWQWTFKDLTISNCRVGIEMTQSSDVVNSGVGSVLLMDSSLSNVEAGVILRAYPESNADDVSASLLLDNINVDNVPSVVQDIDGETILGSSGQETIASWGRGSRYTDSSGTPQYAADALPTVNKDASLLSEGRFYAKTRPQYEQLTVDDFASVKASGAVGDGVTDDSDAIQATIDANVNGKVVYFPAGTYIIGKTVRVPPGTRMIGETWSVLMAGGAPFQDENNPQPMLQVGQPGDSGMVEITDLFFCSQGAQPGAILVEWNIHESSQGSASMWDSHFRVGGHQGSSLQVAQCPKGQSAVPECNGVHTLLHITPSGSGYFENVWAWTADHDLDNGMTQGQISIYTGRGVLIESTDGPVWLYGTQSEHNVFYQYQLTNTRNVFMTMIQSETPYWQPGPPVPQPYTPNPVYSDPTYEHCEPGDIRCPLSYSTIITGSSNIYLYGAGMYNFFNNYDQTCLDTEDCQTSMVNLEGNTALYMFNINTKAAANMVVESNTNVLATNVQNTNGFCRTINAFLAQA